MDFGTYIHLVVRRRSSEVHVTPRVIRAADLHQNHITKSLLLGLRTAYIYRWIYSSSAEATHVACMLMLINIRVSKNVITK